MKRENLIAAGVDYDEGVKRFSGHPEIYEKYLAKFFNGPLMGILETQLAAKDITGAFQTAHNLKGTAGNLSVNDYYEKICELTELLRTGDTAFDYSTALLQTKSLYDAAAQAVREKSA